MPAPPDRAYTSLCNTTASTLQGPTQRITLDWERDDRGTGT
jgi:hypothetical protein